MSTDAPNDRTDREPDIDRADAHDPDLGDERLTQKDVTYSPSSERETETRQDESASGLSDTAPEGDEEPEGIVSRPGVGGADDAGDVNVDDEAIRERIAQRDASPGDRPVG